MRLCLALLTFIFSLTSNSQKYYLFIGTYTNTGSKGIYVYRFDASTGKAEWVSNTEGVINPSYLSIAPGGKYLYACTETRTANAGSVSAFVFNSETGALAFINKQPSGDDNPVYITVHKSGRWVVNGNYTGGSLSVYPVNADGSLQAASQVIQHNGSSVNKERQDRPHVHSTIFSPSQDYLMVPDLGLDKILIYRFTATALQPLQYEEPLTAITYPGSGPRHLTFHPNGKYVYLAEEMSGTVMAYTYKEGRLDSLQQLPAHGDTATAPFGSADIHTSPDGRFLYVSNRGKENNIAIFSIHQQTGKLTIAGYESTLGQVPRNFIVEPSGKFLLVANQETGNVVVYKRNKKSGLLQPMQQQIKVPLPTCLQMLRVK